MANGSSETEILALAAFRHAFRQTTPAVALNHPPATASACSIETSRETSRVAIARRKAQIGDLPRRSSPSPRLPALRRPARADFS